MPLEIRVHTGDATAVRGQPALVVAANKQLTLDWGSHLAEKVRGLAGHQVEQEALAQRPDGIELGEAVLTGAGTLPGFTHLIHAAVLDKYDFNPLFLLRLKERTSEATLRGAVHSSLLLAEEAGLSGLVVTPMGAGIGGMRMRKCARIIVEEVRRFEPDAEHVRAVVIACFKDKAARLFREQLAQA